MQQAAPHAPGDEVSALREALLDPRQIVRVLSPVAEDYARRARAYPQIKAIYYRGSSQGPTRNVGQLGLRRRTLWP